MTDRDQAFLIFWAKERAKGKTQYIIINSIIFFVMLNLVSSVFNFKSLMAGDFSWFFIPSRLMLYVLVSIILVIFRWRRNEKYYEGIEGKK